MSLFDWIKTEEKYNEFFNIIPPLNTSLPIVAGGAALHLYQGGKIEDCRDIDIFFDTTAKARKFIKKLTKTKDRFEDLGWKENAHFNVDQQDDDYIASKTIKIDINDNIYDINFVLQPGLKYKRNKCLKLLNTFDFTVAQVATDGTEFIFGERTIKDIEARRLSFIDIDERIEFVTNPTIKLSGYYGTTQTIVREADHKLESVLFRIKKYKEKGFQPDEEMLQFVLKYG